jgi:hypothetical protein
MPGPRELFDRQQRLVEAGDLDGLLAQYHEDAVLVRFDRVVRGRAALREYFTAYLAQRPRILELLQYAEADDVVSYQAVLELAGEQVRAHGTLMLRGERIHRQVAGLFPAIGGLVRAKGEVQVDLDPYTAWVSRPVPDPRSAGRETIGPALLEIVDAEGPILAERAYRLYVRASGGKALTTIARAPLSGAAFRLRQAGAVEFEGEDEVVLRLAGTPPVRVRDLGPRTLDEVPAGELAELMGRLARAGANDLARAVLDTYGLVRMTAKAEQLLEAARERAGWG